MKEAFQAKRGAALLLASLAFAWLFFAEYLSPFRHVHIPYDLEGYHYPLVDYAFQSLRQGRFPQWDWSEYSGITFVGNMQAALFYPPMWFLFLANAGRDHVSYQSLQTFVIVHAWLGSVLCFLWLRRRGLGNFASIAGAQVFAFSGYVCLQLQHQGLVTAFAWFPLGAWGIDEASERRDWWPLWKLIAASALCFLTGYPPMWIVFAVTMTAYAIGKGQTRTWVGTLFALGFSLLVAMVQILPAWESARFMEKADHYGVGIRDPRFFLSYLLPNYFNFGLNVPVMTNPGMEYLYLGVPGLLGILLVIRFKQFMPALPALLVLAANGILLTNPFGMIWGVIQYSDMLSQLVRAWYFLAGIAFAMPLIAALGIDAFLKQPSKLVSKSLAGAAAGALLAWSCWELWRWFHQGFSSGWGSAWITGCALALFTAGLYCLRAAHGRERSLLFAALVLFAGADYKVFGTSKRFNAAAGSGPNFHSDSFANLDKQAYRDMRAQTEYRVVLDHTAPLSSIAHHWGIRTAQGFDPLLTKQYRALLGKAAAFYSDREFDIDPSDDAALRLLGVRYFVTAETGQFYAAVANSPKFRLVGSGEPYYKTFEYLDASPSYGAEGAEVEAVRWSPEHRVFRVRSSAATTLHLSEQLLPGWRATVDGAPVNMERWQRAFQAAAVPAGRHTVEFRFMSPGMIAGAFVSVCALGALLWMVWRSPVGLF